MIAPADDIDPIMAVMQAAFPPEYGEAWSRRQVEDALLAGLCHYALASAAPGQPAAGFYLARDGYEEAELLLLAVAPAARRRGLARDLLARFAATARANGARRLLLEMRRGNPAERLYREFGFVPIGERRNYYRSAGAERIDAITFACEVQAG